MNNNSLPDQTAHIQISICQYELIMKSSIQMLGKSNLAPIGSCLILQKTRAEPTLKVSYVSCIVVKKSQSNEIFVEKSFVLY